MRSSEFISEAVVQGNFGRAETNNSIKIPQGYASFYAKKLGKSSGEIVGVKADGSKHRISTTSNFQLADALAKEYNSGGTAGTGIKSTSMLQAFGSKGLNLIKDLNIPILEKPSYFNDIRRRGAVSEIQYAQLKRHISLPEYTDVDVFGKKVDDMDDNANPLAKANLLDDTFIIHFTTSNNKYIVDTSGAKSYIRNWAYLNF